MSEKLKQCRQGLAAALDRALEDVTITPPSIKHPPYPLYPHSESKESESPAYLETRAELQRRSLPVCSPGPMVYLPTAIPMDLHRNSSRSYSWPISFKEALPTRYPTNAPDSCVRQKYERSENECRVYQFSFYS